MRDPIRFGQLILAVAFVAMAPTAQLAAQIDFQSEVLPILAENCFACHGPDASARQGDLRLDVRQGLFGDASSGARVVAPREPRKSELLDRVTADNDERMPPPDSGKQLTRAQIETIETWVREGAPWSVHWALTPPERPKVPGKFGDQRAAIDAFIRAAARQRGLPPSPPADRSTLIRRVTLDLTGLPPTLDEVENFMADDSPDAYERLVDRLLASPRYGERMAVPWLDAARYADTHGYLFDTERQMWRWRDWVIGALNRNQPFDEFTRDQLAGDLLPHATDRQKIATGFHRNHLINNEAGAIPAEYLVENIVDRVNTTATVWLGLSLACCQCHDHKYDPFSQREYYQLYAFFNRVPELGLDGLNTNAKPVMKAPTAGDKLDLQRLAERLNQAADKLRVLEPEIRSGQAEWESKRQTTTSSNHEGLIAHWKFDGQPDDNFDSKTPTVFEAAPEAYAQGVMGKAAQLEGLAYVNAGNRLDFDRVDKFSLAVWVRASSKAGRMSIVSRMENAKKLFRGYTLQTFLGNPSFFLLNQFPDNLIQVQAEKPLEVDRWTHLAVTYDGTAKAAGVKMYVDGKLQKPSVTIDKLTDSFATSAPFWIGNGHPGAKFKGRIDDLRVYDRVLTKDEITAIPGLSIDSLLAIDEADRNPEQARRIRKHYLEHHADDEWRTLHDAHEKLKRQVAQRERSMPTVMVMSDAPKPRKTRVLLRGAYNKPGDTVEAATPAVLHSFGDRPRNRLGLAKWIVDSRNPLTARVVVNRYWQLFFGAGLVSTTEDFGVQGTPPTHPKLLDWLAVELVENAWDAKAIHRLIVTSATYRQSARLTPAAAEIDPQNRWLARGPRKRLPAEVIRDQSLAYGGLLVEKIGGPSVRPYQPDGLWREVAFDFSGANLTAQIYKQDSGEKLYRRSFYTFWKRTAPPPSMLLFDAPDRERCVVRRERTSTPLQALVLMNDPTYVEAARMLAERVLLERPQASTGDRLAYMFRIVLARTPTSAEGAALQRFLENQQTRFQENAADANRLLTVGATERNPKLKASTVAAYTLVANLMLNLDETISPR